MHYYKKNIGDYHKKAGRLSMLQHGAYTLLIDACYDREKFPTLEDAIDWLWASCPEEVAAVEFVLSKFFILEDGVYVQKRIKVELDKYHENSATNKRIAIERETKRKRKSTKREQSVDDTSTKRHLTKNQEPLTKNQELVAIVKEKGKTTRFAPPSQEDVGVYFLERGHQSAMQEAENFIDFYSAKGWMIGKNKMKCWKAAVRNWMKNDKNFGVKNETSKQADYDKTFDISDTSW